MIVFFCLLKGVKILLSENLKKIRKEQRYSQNQLAKLVGCTATNIQNMENGINDNPKLKTLIAISKVLKVSITKLIK